MNKILLLLAAMCSVSFGQNQAVVVRPSNGVVLTIPPTGDCRQEYYNQAFDINNNSYVCNVSSGSWVNVGTSSVVRGVSIVAQLPLAATSLQWAWLVTDGSTGSDCSVGGGSDAVWCYSNGSAWSSIGGATTCPGSLTGTANAIIIDTGAGACIDSTITGAAGIVNAQSEFT